VTKINAKSERVLVEQDSRGGLWHPYAFMLLTSADEGGVTVGQSIEFMLSEPVPTKKMGIE